jgi:transcription elongation GreA/GreB family factor
MDKHALLKQILERLQTDYALLLQAAKSAHAAATHEDNIPDSKYETLALEASYIAQGQANRAQEIKQALEAYQKLQLQDFGEDSPIRLTALIKLEDEAGNQRWLFIGPAAGGMKLNVDGTEVLVITPDSPLGEQLIGLQVDDSFELLSAGKNKDYEIIAVC